MFCPFCSTDGGRALRQALGEAPIAVSLFATLLPFLVLAVAVVAIRSWATTAVQARAGEPSRQARGNDEPAR